MCKTIPYFYLNNTLVSMGVGFQKKMIPDFFSNQNLLDLKTFCVVVKFKLGRDSDSIFLKVMQALNAPAWILFLEWREEVVLDEARVDHKIHSLDYFFGWQKFSENNVNP